MKQPRPTSAVLRSLLTFEGETGKLFWKERSVDMFKDGARTAEQVCNWWNSRYAHNEAFTAISHNGFRTGMIAGVHFKAHRLIWCLIVGYWPTDELIHKNHNKLDNRLGNLMEMTHGMSRQREARIRSNAKKTKTSHRRSA